MGPHRWVRGAAVQCAECGAQPLSGRGRVKQDVSVAGLAIVSDPERMTRWLTPRRSEGQSVVGDRSGGPRLTATRIHLAICTCGISLFLTGTRRKNKVRTTSTTTGVS